ncbi:hypothetical protein KR038_002270 [Drosophila bunnanda]|nr:hypothetical protein KR038_002270 [Drosophila bunnanda]
MEQEIPENGQYYSCGKPLSNLQSASDETIVNGPRVPTSEASDASSSYNLCCPLRRPGQQPVCYSCHHGYPYPEHLMQMALPQNMDIDPNTGYPYFPFSAPVSYPSMGMGSMPGAQVDQRGRGGQQNEDMNGSSGSSTAQCSSQEGGSNQSTSNFNMEEFIQKYQKSVQQCYATAQQGLRQSFAQANGQGFFNQPINQQYYANSNSGAQPMFSSPTQAAPQFYEPNQEAYQGMQAFNSTLDPQQFFTSPGLGKPLNISF